MIRSMTRPITSDASRLISVFGKELLVTKYFLLLNPLLNSFYTLSTPITFIGNIEFTYVASTTGIEMDFANGFGITEAGLFKAPVFISDIELNGVSVGLNAIAPLDNKLNTVKFIGN